MPSPNYDARPVGVDVDLVVIHGISLPPGEYGGDAIERLFTNRLAPEGHPAFAEVATLKVSSHLLLRRDGEVVQFVSLLDRAWHAGESTYQGREACNDFSIGIELEGTDDDPYTASQYETLDVLVDLLANTFPDISRDRVVGHSTIAPGRKTDPGPAFDWARIGCAVPVAELPSRAAG